MKVWLLGLGLALLCTVHASLDDSAVDKALGEWNAIGFATDCKKLMKHMADMKITTVNVEKMENGDIKVVSEFPAPQGCKTLTMVFTKDDDGKYSHECGWGKKTIHHLEFLDDDTAILKAEFKANDKSKDDKSCRIVTLNVRNWENQPMKVLEDFKQNTMADGFTDDQIKMMPNELACPKTEKRSASSSASSSASLSEEQVALP